MKVLKHWFWKYQIFFNKDVYNDVMAFSKYLTPSEKDMFLKEIEFFKSFYTIQLLLDALDKKSENDSSDIINYAITNIDKLTKLNSSLYNYYVKIINKKYKILRTSLLYILSYSYNESTLLITFNDYLKIIINTDFDDFLRYLKSETLIYKNCYSVNTQKNIKSLANNSNTLKSFYNAYSVLTFDKNINNMFGTNKIDKFNVIIKKLQHYGEFWDVDFYDNYNTNTLILKKNLNKLNINDFIYTIVHETYPGHAHFFKTLKTNNMVCDTGALFLFEGYATACELLIGFNKHYEDNLKSKYLKIINFSLFGDDLSLPYNKNIIIDLMTLNQYVALNESYYAGAFYILYLLHNKRIKSINEFLENIKKYNIGNFSLQHFRS